MFRGINPDGGSIEVFNLRNIPENWEFEEFEVDNEHANAESEIEALRVQTRSEISSLIFEHTQKLMMRGIPIPEDVQIQYDLKRTQYQAQKQAIYNKYNIINNQ